MTNLIIPSGNAYSYKILYAEQFYRLYHSHFYQYPQDYLENIYYLEESLRSDFANPLNALSKINNKNEWRRYMNLFRMHVSLKLTELYLGLGSKYDKMEAYFYNSPWKRENLRSLDVAEESYRFARVYWKEALKWQQKVEKSWIVLEDIQKWEDESYRIEEKLLDYDDIIDSHLKRLENVRNKFLDMNENTY
jgi:hypothetical protein